MTCTCPYCDAEVEICHDDGFGYAEDETYQYECDSCGKHFVFTTSISFYHSAEKAECLNGGEHEYKESITYPRRYTKLFCSMCGDEKPLPADHPYLKEQP